MRTLVVLVWLILAAQAGAADYAVVVSEKTRSDPEWNRVVLALQREHHAQVFAFAKSVEETLGPLRQSFPRYACFVARPEEAGRAFVASVHRLARNLDDDPYSDCFWGIVTGYDAAAALRLAKSDKPLVVRKVAAGTEVALDLCEEGMCYDELVKNKLVQKEKGGRPTLRQAPDDTTAALVKTLTDYRADLFITSGHATERDWQIGYRYRNGSFRCAEGQLYGLDTQGNKYPILSPNPKVYLPVGNCLMGHIDGKDAIALAWMNSGGVKQMAGYTVLTWYGYAGWGCLDYFVEEPGRYTFSEAVRANGLALIHRLQNASPGAETAALDDRGRLSGNPELSAWAQAEHLSANDLRGLAYDRDTLAFYGDPAWQARMARGPLAWDQSLTEKRGVWTFSIQPRRGEKSFEPINTNGSQRGYRPFVQFLPKRVGNVQILEGLELKPVVTDDFVLVPNPKQCPGGKALKVVFRAENLK